MITILIADDQALVASGFRAIVDAQPDMEVVAEVADGRQAVEVAGRLQPDEFAQRRGLTEVAAFMAAGQTPLLAELGQVDAALSEAASLADRLEGAGDITFAEPRALQLRLLAERGQHERAPSPEPMLKAARDSGQPQWMAMAVAAGANLLDRQGHPEQARLLLAELERITATRTDDVYAIALPGLVRSALALHDPDLAASLTDGVEPVTPLRQHALTASRAQLAEAAGDDGQAAVLYVDAAERWDTFGTVPECAYALLGHGRTLTALGNPEAGIPLRQARTLFAAMGYQPALAEIEALLNRARTATS